MFKRFVLLCSVFIFSLILNHSTIFAETDNLGNSGKMISPVYEEMLANEIYLLWRDFFSQKVIQETDPFYVQSDDSDQSLAVSVSSILKKKYPAINWRTEISEANTSFGVLFIQDGNDEYLDLRNEQGYVLVFANDPVDGVIEKLRKRGFNLRSKLSLFELEHIKNERGRQIFNLDDPRLTRRVFERMVRKGMNPVHAHPATEEAIKDFRKLKEPKLLIFDRMSS